MTGVSGRQQRLVNGKLGHRRRREYGLAARLIGARRLPIGLAIGRAPSDRLSRYSYRKCGEHRDHYQCCLSAIRFSSWD